MFKTTNRSRARRAQEAAIAYDGEDRQWSYQSWGEWDDVDRDLARQVIKDLVGDLHHLCDHVGLDFDELAAASLDNYHAEVAEEDE